MVVTGEAIRSGDDDPPGRLPPENPARRILYNFRAPRPSNPAKTLGWGLHDVTAGEGLFSLLFFSCFWQDQNQAGVRLGGPVVPPERRSA
jgi:hypothetical protein